jgi:hypothetical protein
LHADRDWGLACLLAVGGGAVGTEDLPQLGESLRRSDRSLCRQSVTIGPRSKILSDITGLLHTVTELEVDIPEMRLPVVTALGPY